MESGISMPTDDELRELARERAKEKVGFYSHLSAYVLVNLLLIVIWYFTTGPGSFPWWIFVTLLWGIGIASHYFGVFHGPAYTDRMAEREYQRLKEGR
jgi:hypothetical protein